MPLRLADRVRNNPRKRVPRRRWRAALAELLESRCLMSVETPAALRPDAIFTGNLIDEPPGLDYQLQNRWTSTASGSAGSTGNGITLTWSIVPDGTTLSTGWGEPNTPSDLVAKMNSLYGAQSNWLPLFTSIFNAWGSVTGITYIYEPNDDGLTAPMSSGNNGILGVRGDVRIGAHAIPSTGSNLLAYNWYPSYGDMVIDDQDLSAGGYFTNTSSNSLRLRNTLGHEHGHGIGLAHTDPLNGTKLMEALLNTGFDGPQFDDILGAQRYYGDINEKGAGNNIVANATNRGTLNNGTDSFTQMSVATTTDVDFYKFTLSTAKEVVMTLTPYGPTYLQGPQNGTTSSFNAAAQMNLQVQLLASNGTTVLWTANDTGVGSAESFDIGTLAAGTYYLKVSAAPGATDSAQMYTLSTVVSDAIAATTTIALDGSNNLTITDSAGGGKNDLLTVTADTANSRFVISDTSAFLTTAIGTATGNNMHTVYVPFAAVAGAGVTISTLAGSDTINVTGGAKPITVNAGNDTDTINILETSGVVPVSIASATGGDAVNINTDATGTALVSFPVSQAIGALTIGSGGIATLAGTSPNPPAEVLVTTSVAITGTGSLNLVNNDLIINYPAFSPLGTWNGTAYSGITGLITSGRNGGAWNGNGIRTSMTAASAANPITTLGIAEASQALGITAGQTGTFDSQTVDNTTLLIKYTYAGDANLNGQITGDDYFRIDAGYTSAGTGYSNGDFDYSGKINADDYFRIDYDYNKTTTTLLFAPPAGMMMSESPATAFANGPAIEDSGQSHLLDELL